MSLRLLPHKSWNVWSKRNIERVRRDEARYSGKLKGVESRDGEDAGGSSSRSRSDKDESEKNEFGRDSYRWNGSTGSGSARPDRTGSIRHDAPRGHRLGEGCRQLTPAPWEHEPGVAAVSMFHKTSSRHYARSESQKEREDPMFACLKWESSLDDEGAGSHQTAKRHRSQEEDVAVGMGTSRLMKSKTRPVENAPQVVPSVAIRRHSKRTRSRHEIILTGPALPESSRNGRLHGGGGRSR